MKPLMRLTAPRWRLRAVFVCLLALLVLAVLAFAMGPRLQFGPEAPSLRAGPPARLAELEGWLQASESRWPDIRAGTEKTVIWAGQPGQISDWAVVYIHGFGASRLETAPLAEQVAQALGANLFYTRLTGHGRSSETMGEASAQDWMADTLEAARIGQLLGRRVLLISCSTGSTLSTWLGMQPQGQSLAAQVFISPNFGPKDKRSDWLLGPWGERIAYAVAGATYGQASDNVRVQQAWTAPYPTRAIFPMITLVDKVRRSALSTFVTPLLVFYSEADQRVEPAHTKAAFARMGSGIKRLVAVDYSESPTQHVLAGDLVAPKATEPMAKAVLQWVHSLP